MQRLANEASRAPFDGLAHPVTQPGFVVLRGEDIRDVGQLVGQRIQSEEFCGNNRVQHELVDVGQRALQASGSHPRQRLFQRRPAFPEDAKTWNLQSEVTQSGRNQHQEQQRLRRVTGNPQPERVVPDRNSDGERNQANDQPQREGSDDIDQQPLFVAAHPRTTQERGLNESDHQCAPGHHQPGTDREANCQRKADKQH